MARVFRAIEDDLRGADLALLAKICRGIIDLNNQRILEFLFSDEFFMATFGILECIVPAYE